MSGIDSRWAHQTSARILERMAAQEYKGWDPYDALAAARPAGLGARMGVEQARLLTQLIKKCPVPLEPVFGVPRTASAYTYGESLTAASRLWRTTADAAIRSDALRLTARLRDTALRNHPGMSWGSAFDVATRFGFFPKEVPNAVVTAFAARGLCVATESGVTDCRADLGAVADFIEDALPTRSDETGVHYGYSPYVDEVILNSSMLVAMTLADAGRLLARSDLTDRAVAAAGFVAARQSADGGWPYSERDSATWVDGFHTSFILQGLLTVLQAREEPGLRACVRRGIRHYCGRLFSDDGLPRLTPARPWPSDSMCASQAIELLERARGVVPAAEALLASVLGHVSRRFVRDDGRVAYQVHRGWTDWRWFPRWSGAPMAAALAGVTSSRMNQSTSIDPTEEAR